MLCRNDNANASEGFLLDSIAMVKIVTATCHSLKCGDLPAAHQLGSPAWIAKTAHRAGLLGDLEFDCSWPDWTGFPISKLEFQRNHARRDFRPRDQRSAHLPIRNLRIVSSAESYYFDSLRTESGRWPALAKTPIQRTSNDWQSQVDGAARQRGRLGTPGS